jgi:multidrug resistance efflux pump
VRRRILVAAVVLALVGAGALAWWRGRGGETWFTGFVEGEERVLRSEVSGRVLEVRFGEGDVVSPGALVARLDDGDVRARLASKEREVGVLDAEIRRAEEQLQVVDLTWARELEARRADLRQAEAAAELARLTFARRQELFEDGVSAQQSLDEARAQRDSTRSGVDRAREVLARTDAEAGNVELARRALEVAGERRGLALAELEELRVLHAKYAIHAPEAETVVQTQFLWPGELAQPGTPVLAVLDPRDKYVQIYVPAEDLARVRPGRRVEIELDSAPGRRVPGEISFVADQASFTPEKIETRADRLGQVYRAKVRILAGAEGLQPGAEGNVYLAGEEGEGVGARTASSP